MKILLCLLALMLVAVPNVGLFAEEAIPRPDLSIGDWWESTGYRFTVIARNDDGYEMLRSPKGKAADPAVPGQTKLYVTRDFWTSRRVNPDRTVTRFTEDTWYQWVYFPLTVGSRWSFLVRGTDKRDGSSRRYDHDCSAVKWEEIDVSGKLVRAMRIECKSNIRGVASSGWFHTAWYAPEAKRIVRLTSQYSGGPTQEWIAWSVQP